MPGEDSYNTIPTWSGDPAEFEGFVQSCKWYERSLKTSERGQAAARVWSKLRGAAKSVVRHLDPDEFTGDDGLSKLLSKNRPHHYNSFQYPTVSVDWSAGIS